MTRHMTRRMTSGIALLTLAALLAGCASDPVNAADDLPQLLAEWQARSGAVGVAMAVDAPGQPTWVGAEGMSDVDAGTPLAPDDRFRIGSLTKSFTALVALQLVEEGQLQLDDPVANHIDDFPWGDAVTVRHLLAHTSGVPDYQRIAGFIDDQRRDRDRRWTAAELVDLIGDRALDFAPGSRFSYANTNYTLLGQVIEAATGTSWAAEVRQRILEPLEMDDTYIPSVEDVPGGIVGGYADTDADGQLEDVGGDPWPSLETEGEAVGNIISTAGDLLRFDLALFRGELLEPGSMQAMLGQDGAHPLGVHRQGYVADTAVGHPGADPGFAAVMTYLPDHDIGIVVLTNHGAVDPVDLAAVTARMLTRRA